MSSSDSSSDEDETYLSAIASVAVSGTTISANANISAKAAAEKLTSMASNRDSRSASQRFGESQSAAYLTLAQTAPEEDKPLQGPLADKLADQLHKILERTVGSSCEAPLSSSSDEDEDESADEDEDGGSQDEAGEATVEEIGVRLFKTIEEGTPCILTISKGGWKGPCQPEATTWSGRLRGRAGDGSDEEEETLRAAWTVAVEAEDIISKADAAARAASGNICPVVDEVDSDTEWKGGVKPGSSIELSKKAKAKAKAKAGGGSAGGGAGDGASPAKRKRKGKTERLKEARKKAEQEQQGGEEGLGAAASKKEQAAGGAAGGAGSSGAEPGAAGRGKDEEEEARLRAERKREKRRNIKKQRRLSAKAEGAADDGTSAQNEPKAET